MGKKKRRRKKRIVVQTIKQLAEHLDCSPRTIGRWKSKGGMPTAKGGGFEVEACRRWLWEKDGRRNRSQGLEPPDEFAKDPGKKKKAALEAGLAKGNGTTATDDDVVSAGERYKSARADLALIELAEKKDELIPRSLVVEGEQKRVKELTTSLFSLAPPLAEKFATMESPREICDALQRAFRLLCRTFASRSQVNQDGHGVELTDLFD